ncbi:MAG TPA: SRPBCC family protein [Protaetiibacter sp.]|nr:SRPBCC family protein [Protaetiibacter sp.]
MEYGSIEREMYVDAPPEVVFDVVSDPDHITTWWPDSARYERRAGASGEIAFGDPSQDGMVVQLTVVEVSPPRTFAFRWTHGADEDAAVGNSLLVTFTLLPSGGGTLLRFVETGFREMGWDAAVLEGQYNDHLQAWDRFLPRLGLRSESVQAGR